MATTKRQPVAGVDLDADRMTAVDYYADFMWRHACPRCCSRRHVPEYGYDITMRRCQDCGEVYSAEE
ncbi:MAG TPA: hypothetical protein VGR57_05815 [Ktedonobacterales bacterium]|nr:hypothetical protein [Ktedonobacterales bacterium]